MKSLPELIAEACEDSHAPMAQAAFGDAGLEAVFLIMDVATALYQHVEPERIRGQVVILRIIAGADALDSPPLGGPAADFATLANQTITDLAFLVGSDGRAYPWVLTDATPEDLAKTAVVYRYQGGHEEFLAGSERKAVRRFDSAARSQFSVPTFSNLREALQRYAVENVRESTCYVFEHVWADQNRLFFKAGKAEEHMRRSLTQFLRNRLGGDHDVWPEQNVNEKNPVDIRVQPRFSNNRLMLIEIKWLGCSVAADGHITADHKQPRAQVGAEQLAQYLD